MLPHGTCGPASLTGGGQQLVRFTPERRVIYVASSPERSHDRVVAVGVERVSDSFSCANRSTRRRKGCENPVARGLDDDATAAADCGVKCGVVTVENRFPSGVAE